MNKFLIIVFLIFITGCMTEEIVREESVIEEKDNWIYFEDDNGFSTERPDAEGTFNFNETLFMISTKGCNSAVNKYEGDEELMYSWILKYLDTEEIYTVNTDELNNEISYLSSYQNYSIYNKLKIFGCNGYAYNIILSCEQGIFNENEEEFNKLYESAKCDSSKKEKIILNDFKEEDFSMDVPNWEDIERKDDTTILKKGYCNVFITEVDANLDDVYNWIYESVKKCEECNVEEKEGDILDYESYYENILLKSKAGFVYCNYKTYIVSYTCIESMFDGDVASQIVSSINCDRIYEPKEEEITQEEEEEIQEIREESVNLDLPDEWNVENPEMIVWFINSNDFFATILKDYNKINLIIDDETDFNIKADLENGKIVRVEEGLYEGEISIIIPLNSALEILNNADNINFLNFLVFAVEVRTDPPELKQEVINKILGL